MEWGTFRWARAEAAKHRRRFWVASLVGLMAGLLEGIVTPRYPNELWDQMLAHAVPVVVAIILAVGLTFLWSLFRAPYQQRDALRRAVQELAPEDPVASTLSWLEDHAVSLCDQCCPNLSELVVTIGSALNIWTPEESIRQLWDEVFPCPAGATHSYRVVWVELRGRDLVDEDVVQHLEPSRQDMGNFSAVLGLHPAPHHYRYAEYRWTVLGRRVAQRLQSISAQQSPQQTKHDPPPPPPSPGSGDKD